MSFALADARDLESMQAVNLWLMMVLPLFENPLRQIHGSAEDDQEFVLAVDLPPDIENEFAKKPPSTPRIPANSKSLTTEIKLRNQRVAD